MTASTSTRSPEDRLAQAFQGIKEPRLRKALIKTYLDLKRDYVEARFDSAGVHAGKFCEAALRIAQFELTGHFVPLGTQIPNFADAVRALVTTPKAAGPESVREVIPRGLLFLYTLRNKRGIGHLGGDVDANRIDAMTITRVADWVVCELTRLYHGLSLEEAQDLVDGLAQRANPMIWEVGGTRRVLMPGLPAADQTLLLLYGQEEAAVLAEDLCEWVEYTSLSMFKRRVLDKLHISRLVEFDKDNDVVVLSPLGIARVEKELLAMPLAS